MRTFTTYAKADPEAINLVERLPKIQGDPADYRKQMLAIGRHLGAAVFGNLPSRYPKNICVVCTVEDADFLARGVIEAFEEQGLTEQVHLICLWNEKIRSNGSSLSPIKKQYKEDFDNKDVTLVIVKSIISGACVVKTNLTRVISYSQPREIFVVSPVMFIGAEARLSREFPEEISSRFKFVHFATDTEKDADSENIRPGIGGSVYELLGLGDDHTKNKYMPSIVKQRRKRNFPELETA
jgi:hypothetical protein